LHLLGFLLLIAKRLNGFWIVLNGLALVSYYLVKTFFLITQLLLHLLQLKQQSLHGASSWVRKI